MGHVAAKDMYRKLGKKIDGLSLRVPWNDTLYAILKELYTPEEAELVVKMPYSLSNLDTIERVTKMFRSDLQRLLDGLAEKGLVIDVWAGKEYYYVVSPLIIGIFEFTMMRTRGELDMKTWAKLFHEYLQDHGEFYKANFAKGQSVSPLRALPHEGTVAESDFVEVLDYEKASSIVEQAEKFAIGICSCRHEKYHAGVKECDVPLETCASFDNSADMMIRHGFGKEVSRSEMQENIARSKELGLVFCADNVKNNIAFICQCCSCCCNVLLGISRFGATGMLVTSNFIAQNDPDTCIECGTCAESCPINAISVNGGGAPTIDKSICVGCGVCAMYCDTESLRLVKREKRVLHPEDVFERIILQHLEQGNLQNLIFSNPQSTSHGFMRGLVGGFLKLPPVKKSLMSDNLRSSFLNFMRRGG